MHLEAEIERVWRCTWRLRASDLSDVLWGRDRASLEIQLETEIEWTQRLHLEAVIEQVWRFNWRPRLSELYDTLRGRDGLSPEMNSEAMIESTRRCTPSLWSFESGDALPGYDRQRLEEYLEVVDLEVVGGRHARCWDSFHQLVNSKPWECDKLTLPFKLLWRTGWWRSIGREVCWKLRLHSGVNLNSWEWRDDRQSQVYPVLGVCCTQCMLFPVYAALGVCCTQH